jgi:hypothetical protein
VKGELRILVHFKVLASMADPKDFCAIFEGPLLVCGVESYWHREVLRRDQFGIHAGEVVKVAGEVQNDALVGTSHGYQESVFVGNVEFMKPPKRFIPSLVRFQSLDEAYSLVRRSLYHSHVTGFKYLGVSGDGETGFVGDDVPLATDQFANQQVKAGAEIMDSVSSNGTQLKRGLSQDSYLENPIAGIRLVMADDFIGVGLDEPLNRRFEITDVLFGPFDLGIDSCGSATSVGHEVNSGS